MIDCELQACFVKVFDSAGECRVLRLGNAEVDYVEDVAEEKNVNADVWILETRYRKNCIDQSP